MRPEGCQLLGPGCNPASQKTNPSPTLSVGARTPSVRAPPVTEPSHAPASDKAPLFEIGRTFVQVPNRCFCSSKLRVWVPLERLWQRPWSSRLCFLRVGHDRPEQALRARLKFQKKAVFHFHSLSRLSV